MLLDLKSKRDEYTVDICFILCFCNNPGREINGGIRPENKRRSSI